MQDPENGVQVVGLGASRAVLPVRMAAIPSGKGLSQEEATPKADLLIVELVP